MAANNVDSPEIEAETSFEVRLYIYDLSKELSKSFKKILKGKPLPGIWHTGLVAYGREYYFASSGVESCRPGETILGEPDQILTLGRTELPYSVFLEYIFALGESTYKPGTYHLLGHNCNVFSQEVSQFLTGRPIPEELRELQPEILNNKNLSNSLKEYFDKLNFRVEGSKGISFGASNTQNGPSSRKASIDNISVENQNGHASANGTQNSGNGTSKKGRSNSKTNNSINNNNSEQNSKKSSKMPVVNGDLQKEPNTNANKPPETLKKEQKSNEQASASASNDAAPPNSENPQSSQMPNEAASASSENATAGSSGNGGTAVDGGQSSSSHRDSGDAEAETGSFTSFKSRRSKKYPDPPILYTKVDGERSYNKLMELVGERISLEERRGMKEILDYLICPEGGAWALGSLHLDAIGRLLMDRTLPDESPILMLEVLEAAALKEDVILLLHQDREHHNIMSYLYRIENLPHEEQEHIGLFMCNLCSNISSFDWLMYISEWLEDGHSCNNSKVTIRVAVHCLLCDIPSLQEKGSALIYNLALKELFDDSATELAMAVMQFLHADLNEELAFRTLTALLRFMHISYNDVPALMKMMGPDVHKFKAMSERIDQLVEQIQAKMEVSILS